MMSYLRPIEEGSVALERVLGLYKPMLKSPAENPHATLLTTFVNAATHSTRAYSKEEQQKMNLANLAKVAQFIE